MGTGKELTVVIPTRNRPHLVRNQIDYYASVGFPYKIVYIDASEDAHHQSNVESMLRRSQDLSCEVLRAKPSPQTNPARRINDQCRDFIDRIDTPFVCQSGDDDFFFVTALQAAMAELKADIEISACGGYCLLVTTGGSPTGEENARTGEITIMSTTNAIIDSPFERVRNNVAHFSSATYYVSRLSVWRGCYYNFSEHELDSALIEQLMCAVLLANGKVKRLDVPYVLRHLHTRNGDIGRKDLSYDVFDPGHAARIEKFGLQIRHILEKAGADLPDDWDVQIRLGILSMSLSDTNRRYKKKVREWYDRIPAPSIRDLVGGSHENRLLQGMLQKVADNAVNGLVDPETSSFLQGGLRNALDVG